MVYIKGSLFGTTGSPDNTGCFELGLSSEPVRINVRASHREIHTDDYGNVVPADVMSMLADAIITMTLVHYDENVLRLCINHAMGGDAYPEMTVDDDGNPVFSDILNEGTLGPAGRTLGAGRDIQTTLTPLLPFSNFTSTNRYISLSILSAKSINLLNPPNLVWRFPHCYLNSQPLEIPLGTERSLVRLSWRALPYKNPLLVTEGEGAGYALGTSGSVVSSGSQVAWNLQSRNAILWDHSAADTPFLGFEGFAIAPVEE